MNILSTINKDPKSKNLTELEYLLSMKISRNVSGNLLIIAHTTTIFLNKKSNPMISSTLNILKTKD